MNTTYLTPQELAGRYKNTVTVKTLANWRCQGSGPAFTKVGGKILYALADVASWEASRKLRAAAGTLAKAVAAVLALAATLYGCGVSF